MKSWRAAALSRPEAVEFTGGVVRGNAGEVLALPIFPELRADERERVVAGIATYFKR